MDLEQRFSTYLKIGKSARPAIQTKKSKHRILTGMASAKNPKSQSDAIMEKSADKTGAPLSAAGRKVVFINQDIEEDLIKEILMHCDLPTRLKMQRVCRYWKYLVILPEVNQVVRFDYSCLLIANYVWELGMEIEQYYYWEEKNKHGVRVADNRRCKLLGSHVRILVYDDLHRPGNNPVDYRVTNWTITPLWFLYTVGRHCLNSEEIILKNTTITMLHVSRKWKRFLEDHLQQPSITLVNSFVCFEREAYISSDRTFRLMLKIPLLTLNWEKSTKNDLGFEVLPCNLNSFFWPYQPEQTAWLAKYAPMLPKKYLNKIAEPKRTMKTWTNEDGVFDGYVFSRVFQGICRIFIETGADADDIYESCDLLTVDYGTMKPFMLRLVAWLVLKEEIPGMEPPPFHIEDVDPIVFERYEY